MLKNFISLINENSILLENYISPHSIRSHFQNEIILFLEAKDQRSMQKSWHNKILELQNFQTLKLESQKQLLKDMYMHKKSQNLGFF